jgi:hypothetical protein
MSAFFALSNPFLWLGLVFGLFFGWRAVSIFVRPSQQWKWDWWTYQIWFNASGAFIGWVAVWWLWNTSLTNASIHHLIALLLGFLGITGNLPYVAVMGRLPK